MKLTTSRGAGRHLLACLAASTLSIRAARAGDGGTAGGATTAGTGGAMEGSAGTGAITIPESQTPDNFGCSVMAPPARPGAEGAALALLGVAAISWGRARHRARRRVPAQGDGSVVPAAPATTTR